MQPDDTWHLDKRVPIALIGALILQTFAFGWWASAITSRVELLERQVVGMTPQAGQIIRLEENMRLIRESLSEIKILLRPNRQNP